MLTLDPFSRLSAVTDLRCEGCGSAVDHDDAACSACGLAITDESDAPLVNLLSGPASARQMSKGRSGAYERIEQALDAVCAGEQPLDAALAQLDETRAKFDRWWGDLSGCDESGFFNDEELQMHREYVDICHRLRFALAAYRDVLARGDLRGARGRLLGLDEGFAHLKDLRDHYESLGY